jgi:hypothetical protein
MIVPLTARQAVVDDVFEGIKIPRATLIHFYALAVNMNPEFWGPDAEEFRPERWDDLKDVPNTQFLTFQHGILSYPLCVLRSFRGADLGRYSSVHRTQVCGIRNESLASGVDWIF